MQPLSIVIESTIQKWVCSSNGRVIPSQGIGNGIDARLIQLFFSISICDEPDGMKADDWLVHFEVNEGVWNDGMNRSFPFLDMLYNERQSNSSEIESYSKEMKHHQENKRIDLIRPVSRYPKAETNKRNSLTTVFSKARARSMGLSCINQRVPSPTTTEPFSLIHPIPSILLQLNRHTLLTIPTPYSPHFTSLQSYRTSLLIYPLIAGCLLQPKTNFHEEAACRLLCCVSICRRQCFKPT